MIICQMTQSCIGSCIDICISKFYTVLMKVVLNFLSFLKATLAMKQYLGSTKGNLRDGV